MKDHPGCVAILSGLLVLIGGVVFYSECEWFYLKSECVGGPMADGVRNIIFILAGIGAFYGLHVRTEQLNLERNAQKLERKTRAEENISRAVKQTDSEGLPIRCVGVRLLKSVVEENPEKAQIVTDILKHFVEGRCPIKLDMQREASFEEISEADELDDPDRPFCVDPPDRRERKDVEIALQALGEIVPEEKRKGIEFSDLDFRGLHLQGANFRKFKFSKIRLSKSDLSNADLRQTNFDYCHMDQINLTSAKLQKAYLRHMDFRGVTFFAAIFEETDCSCSDFREAHYGLFISSEGTVLNQAMKKVVQDQINGMIYNKMFRNKDGSLATPKLPPGIDLPEGGAYEIEIDENFGIFRKFIKSGKRQKII